MQTKLIFSLMLSEQKRYYPVDLCGCVHNQREAFTDFAKMYLVFHII